ncbi:MAG: hypothetical protein ACLQVI_06680 [Polyangiaceae bacterium]
MEAWCVTPAGSNPGLVCDLAAPAVDPLARTQRNEHSVLRSVFGGALGTVLALSVVAGLLALFDSDLRPFESTGITERAAAISKEAPAKRLAIDSDLFAKPATRALPPPRPPHPSRPSHKRRPVAHPTARQASDVEVANALAHAELASALP